MFSFRFTPEMLAPAKPVITFARVGHAAAKPFIVAHHYSGNCPTGQNWFFAAYVDGEIYAIAAYGTGANMDGGASLARMTGLPVDRANHATLKRLCRRGVKGTSLIPMSKFLAYCHRLLKRENKIEYIVSYSDAHENGQVIAPPARSTKWQSGGVYAASNFRWLGQVPAERHFKDRDGNFVHRRTPYRLMKRSISAGTPMTMPEAQAIMGLTAWTAPPKERWFIAL